MAIVYVIEPVIHAGKVFAVGETIDADQNDTAALLSSGRCTLDKTKVPAQTEPKNAKG